MSTSVGTVSPDRYRSMSVSSSLSVMIPSMSASRASCASSDASVTAEAVRVPDE